MNIGSFKGQFYKLKNKFTEVSMALCIVASVLITAIVVGWLFVAVLRAKMISNVKSKYNFEETCKKIEEVVPKGEGWGFPIPAWEFYESQIKKNLKYDNIKNCKIYFVCKSKYANQVVSDDPKWSGIMPCSWSVYELTNGDTYVAKMNIPLMSKMFTGVLGTVMKKVAKEEEEFIKEIAE